MSKDVDLDNPDDETTFSDDLMPNEGSAFDTEEEDRSTEHDTQVEANAEAEMILGSAPIMGHLNEWFMNEIAATDSIAAAMTIAKEYQISKENAMVVLDVIAKVMEIKRVNIDTLKRIYIDKQE